MDLGQPIGEGHGASGLESGRGVQSGMTSGQDTTGFNAALGGEHDSSGLFGGHHSGSTQTPIADKYMSGNTGSRLDNSLDDYDGQRQGQGMGGVGRGALGGMGLRGDNNTSGEAVSGAYEGGNSGAMTGESHAQRAGAGVGPLGENTHSSRTSGTGVGSGLSGMQTESTAGAALAGNEPGAPAGSTGGTALGAGATGHDPSHGALGASGGQYGSSGQGLTSGYTGQGQSGRESSGQQGQGHSGVAGDAGAGGLAGLAAGAGAGSRASGDQYDKADPNRATAGSGGAGHYGRATESNFNRGAPVSDLSHHDSGGPHELVFQESTGTYVHRRDLQGKR